jgi:hypothetical protein
MTTPVRFFDSVGFSDDVATMLTEVSDYGMTIHMGDLDPINNSEDLDLYKNLVVASYRGILGEVKKTMNTEFIEDFNKIEPQIWGVTGSVSNIDGVGGQIRMQTGSTANDLVNLEFLNKNVHVDCKFILTFRVKIENISNTVVEIGAIDDSDNLTRILYNSSLSGNWQLENKLSGTSTVTDSGVSADTNWHTFKFESDGSTLRYCIDEIHKGTHSTNVPTSLMKLYVKQTTLENSTKSSVCDFIKHFCFRMG